MKKIIALLLVMSMALMFVACAGNEETPEATEGQGVVDTEQPSDAQDVAPSEDASDSVEEEEVTDAKGDNLTEEKEDTTEKEETPSQDKTSDNPADWTKEEIVEFYKTSAEKSHSKAVSSQTMAMPKLVVNDGDGLLGGFLNMINPVINDVLAKNAMSYEGITGGYTKLVPSDVKSAKAYKSGNYTVVEMKLVEQTDGVYGDMHGGSVGHAINVLGNVSTAAEQFPAFDIDFENADIKVHYANPTVKVKINDKGIIEKGTWSYTAQVYIRNLKINFITVDKADAEIDYVIVVGGGF